MRGQQPRVGGAGGSGSGSAQGTTQTIPPMMDLNTTNVGRQRGLGLHQEQLAPLVPHTGVKVLIAHCGPHPTHTRAGDGRWQREVPPLPAHTAGGAEALFVLRAQGGRRGRHCGGGCAGCLQAGRGAAAFSFMHLHRNSLKAALLAPRQCLSVRTRVCAGRGCHQRVLGGGHSAGVARCRVPWAEQSSDGGHAGVPRRQELLSRCVPSPPRPRRAARPRSRSHAVRWLVAIQVPLQLQEARQLHPRLAVHAPALAPLPIQRRVTLKGGTASVSVHGAATTLGASGAPTETQRPPHPPAPQSAPTTQPPTLPTCLGWKLPLRSQLGMGMT